ncbi:somatostatin receptor type 5-like [Symsagittifera roscoffensis]|uniref:somatostatin receptor type 5-like n=1 Tax=Symsagittifera roscoffensis TaxID=84072 RepID=UPI00307C9E78
MPEEVPASPPTPWAIMTSKPSGSGGNNRTTMDFFALMESQPHPYAEHPIMRIVSEYMFLVVGAIGIVANIVVIVTVLLTKRLKTNTYILILNACLADLLVLSFKTIPTFFEKRSDQWTMGAVLCKLHALSWTLSDCASILFMVAISAERFIVITKPLHASSILTLRNRVSTVVLIWTVSLLFSCQELIHFQLQDIFGSLVCTKLHVDYLRWFLLLEFLLFYLAPLATMVYLYGAVIRSIYQSISIRRAMVAAPSGCGVGSEANETNKSRLKIVFMMIVVGALFFITSSTAKWSILFCTHVLGYTPLNEFGDHFYAYFFFENIFIIRSLDSFANPFIYYALSANLREAFYDHATKNCRPKPTTANPSNARGMSTMTSRQFGTTTSLGASNYEMHSTAQNGKISASNLSEGPKRKELKLGVGVITQNEENFSRV